MDINNLEIPSGPNLYYDQGFINTLEDHMTLLRTDSNTDTAQIDAYKAIVYEGDFFGLLLDMGIPREFHMVTMRVNNMNSPTEFGPGREFVLLPDRNRLGRMLSLYSVQNKIRN